MLCVIAVSLIAVLIATGYWFSTLRSIDQMSLVARTLAKFNLQYLLLKRPPLSKIKLSTGFETVTPGPGAKHAFEEVLNFKMRKDDVIVATYSKAGTTWMQEIAWLICNDADVRTAKSQKLIERFGFLEVPEIDGFGKGFQSVEKWPRSERRFIKTHLPFQALPTELQANGIGKMIYVVRNPKDNCVSYYHFYRMNNVFPFPGTWSEFLTKFCNGEVVYGSWFDHVHKYWEVYQQRKDTLHVVSYESLHKDTKREVKKIAKFLGKDLSEDQVDAIVQHCAFGSMSKNKNTNYSDLEKAGMFNFNISKFMRKGQVGDWKNHFTINENKAFDEMYEERTKDWTLKFQFELDD